MADNNGFMLKQFKLFIWWNGMNYILVAACAFAGSFNIKGAIDGNSISMLAMVVYFMVAAYFLADMQ